MSNDRLEPFNYHNTIISHLKGARTLSVWEDLTVCDFLDIIDSCKLVGWGKKWGSRHKPVGPNY